MSSILVLAPASLFLVLLIPFALRFVLPLAADSCTKRGAWRASRALGRVATWVFGTAVGDILGFQWEISALREAGRLADAAELARARITERDFHPWNRNVAIDILISAGAYEAALRAEPATYMPTDPRVAQALVLIQINLAEAEYNLGRWNEAEARLRSLDLACWYFPITRAGLLQQRAWIAAHRDRAPIALRLCASIEPHWLPPDYRSEYHFTRVAALLAAGRINEAQDALVKGERLARRQSTKRNALFLRARIAASRDDWTAAESACRAAVEQRTLWRASDETLSPILHSDWSQSAIPRVRRRRSPRASWRPPPLREIGRSARKGTADSRSTDLASLR